METIDRKRFGTFVAKRRKELGMTQQELADRLFLSNKAVSKWETGQSLPDITLLEPLAGCLKVSVAELLRGERVVERPLEPEETETLVDKAIQFADEGSQRDKHRRRWQGGWAVSTVLGFGGLCTLFWNGVSREELVNTVFLTQLLCLIFGFWAVFFAPARLPKYYDENKVSSFSQGPVRLNLAGLRFHNGNWPHILSALRWWLVTVPVVFPTVYGLLRASIPQWGPAWEGGLTLFACLGLLVPTMVVAKKYE